MYFHFVKRAKKMDHEDSQECQGNLTSEAQIVGGESIDRFNTWNDARHVEGGLEHGAEDDQRLNEDSRTGSKNTESQQGLECTDDDFAHTLALQQEAEHRNQGNDDPCLSENV